MSMLEWSAKFNDMDYKRVALDELPNGYRVSTVWLGLDHSFGGATPLIFETMVFPADGWGDEDCARYSTEAEAIDGHAAMVAKWTSAAHPKERG